MKLGVLGGTFNPVHIAHLRVAEEVAHRFKLGKILFIPAGDPPLKNDADLAPADDRLKMVQLAIADNSLFEASDIEIRTEGKSYTVNTLKRLRENRMDLQSLFFIVGADAFSDIKLWHDYSRIFELASIIVVARPAFKSFDLLQYIPEDIKDRFFRTDNENMLKHESGNIVVFQQVTLMDISSSYIREELKKGGSIRYLVPTEVENYIREHSLYIK